jgi:hypothetical protein
VLGGALWIGLLTLRALRPVFLLAFFGALYAALARLALDAFPFSGDEYSSLLQAEIFAKGMLHTPAPLHADLLRVDHVVIDQWVRSKYPPGAAVLLALGVLVGAPWLVTPIEGVIALAFVWKAARTFFDENDALVAVALIGAAPLFMFNAASFYSHASTTMWLAAAFASLAAWSLDGRAFRLLLMGAAMGCAFVTRPLDAFLFGVALLAFRSVRVVALAIAGATPFFLANLVYQAAQFGSPFTDGYRAYAPTQKALYGADAAASQISFRHFYEGIQIFNHLDIFRAFLLDWTVPGMVLLAYLGWFALRDDARAAPMRRFAGVLLVLFPIVLLVSMADFDDGARPRYLSITLVPLAWLGGPAWRGAREILRDRIGQRATWIVGIAVWVLPLLQLTGFLSEHIPRSWIREGLTQAVSAAEVRDGIVVVRAEYPSRYARNGPFFDRPVLYVSAPATTSIEEVAEAFPDRPVYEAHEPPIFKPWTLTRVR